MNAVTHLHAACQQPPGAGSRAVAKQLLTLDEHVVEIMSDSGEGAQKCGQSFGAIAARMGNGVWTVEIIPAEIQPPARSVAGASGNRIRIGSQQRHQRRRRDRPRGRVQRAGAARPRQRGRAEARLHRAAREHVGESTRREDRRLSTPRPATGSSPRATACTKCRWRRSAARWSPTRARARTCSCSGCSATSTASTWSWRATRSRSSSARRTRRSSSRTWRCSRPAGTGPRTNLDFKYRIPAVKRDGAAGRHQRQHGARARRARFRHGHLRDVPDHAGDVGFALPERRVRDAPAASCTRPRTRSPPARSPSAPPTPARCAVTITSGPGLFAEAGRHRPRRHGGDPARRRERAARRPEHRPADEGRAGRPAHRRCSAATATRRRS